MHNDKGQSVSPLAKVARCFSLALLGAVCTTLAAPTLAHADDSDEGSRSRRDRDGTRTHIAVDFDFGGAIDEPGAESGGGGAIRLGQELDLFLVSLTPELGGSYHSFTGDADNRLYAGFLGGRLGFGKIIEPSIFAHVGVGHLNGVGSRTAPLMDGGLAIDLTILPLIDLGVHGGYNVLFARADSGALDFYTLGAHAALVL
jgi:hypothetical protein